MEKLEIDARFALGPSAMHAAMCGPESSERVFFEYIGGKIGPGDVLKVLEKLPNLDSFQKTLAQTTGKDPFSVEIQEAYWIGNSLLGLATDPELYEMLLDNYKKHGAFSGFISELRERKPKKIVLHHNFQVSQIGVVDAGGSLDRNLAMVNKCLVRGGEIKKIGDGIAEVNLWRLEFVNGKYELRSGMEKVKFDDNLIEGLQKGDRIAVHWGSVAMKISPEQSEQLDYWTRQTAEIL